MLESILSDVEKYLGLRAVKGTHEMHGFYLLHVPEAMDIWVKDQNPGFYMRSVICPPGPIDEEVLIHLMKANFLGQGAGGGIISLDPEEKFLILSRCINYDVNYKIFRDHLEDFVNYLEYWRKEIQKQETRQV